VPSSGFGVVLLLDGCWQLTTVVAPQSSMSNNNLFMDIQLTRVAETPD
jgi:hypothetical protein